MGAGVDDGDSLVATGWVAGGVAVDDGWLAVSGAGLAGALAGSLDAGGSVAGPLCWLQAHRAKHATMLTARMVSRLRRFISRLLSLL